MGRGFGCEYLSDARLQLALVVEIGHVVKDAKKREVDTESGASEFDAGYYEKLHMSKQLASFSLFINIHLIVST